MSERAELVQYNAARRALAEAVRLDDVKHIRDKTLAMELYAYQRRDSELMAWSAELKKRAGRRLGQVMAELRAAKKLAKATGGLRPKGHRVSRKPDAPPTLAEQNIDKNLANEARKLAAMSEEKFEADVAKTIKVAVASVEGTKAIIAAARADSQREKKEKRAAKERALAERTITAAKTLGCERFGVIYADPPWRWEPRSVETGMDRAAENHYPTMATDAIAAMPVPAADDCVLFLWATIPMMIDALHVMASWGFTYKSQFVWIKDKMALGYWVREQHEILLIGTKGNIPAPAPGEQYPSVITAPRGEHSTKPFAPYEMIEEMFPSLPRKELFARGKPRAGWDQWGNEVEDAAN